MKKILFSFVLLIFVDLRASHEECRALLYKLLCDQSNDHLGDMMKLQDLLLQYPCVAQDTEILCDAVGCKGSEPVVKLLLQNGAFPNKLSKYGNSAMALMVLRIADCTVVHEQRAMKPMLKLCMQYGGDVDQTYQERIYDDKDSDPRKLKISCNYIVLRTKASELIAEIESEIKRERGIANIAMFTNNLRPNADVFRMLDLLMHD